MVALEASNPPGWLRDFWADPISYLREKGARRIVLFGENEPSPPEDIRFNDYSEPQKFNIDKLHDDERLASNIRDNEKKVVSDLFGEKRLFAKKHDTNLVLNGYWLFRFFNRKVNDSAKDDFEHCVRSLPENEDLIEIIRDRKKLSLLKQCYDKLAGDFNDTSLVLYHGPLRGKPIQTSLTGFCPCPYFSGLFRAAQSANKLTIFLSTADCHLLTGDINFNGAWADMERHFGRKISELDLALVPHHGSRKNWNQAALKSTPISCRWIISAGCYNKHGHPHQNVCQEIVNNGNSFQCANEGVEISTRSLLYL